MIKTACRLAISIALIGACAIWSAMSVGLIPDSEKSRVADRVRQSEWIAIATSWSANTGQTDSFQALVEETCRRNPDIEAVAIRSGNQLLAQWGDISGFRGGDKKPLSTSRYMSVDVTREGAPWATIEVAFRPLVGSVLAGQLTLLGFCGGFLGLAAWILLARSFKYLDPRRAVPARVRNALDSMAEGLIVIDRQRQVMLANEAFATLAGKTAESLTGTDPSEFDWRDDTGNPVRKSSLPWEKCLADHTIHRGTMLGLQHQDDHLLRLLVNASPILEENGNCRGVLISFEDLTDLEEKRTELGRMLEILKTSRDEIRRQNDQLRYLADRDPLTGCYNRRAFHQILDQLWNNEGAGQLCVFMLDIDHFKSINDNHGHSIGDNVIRQTGQLVIKAVPSTAAVCRYGGEEFCVAIPGIAFDEGFQVAESIRKSLASSTLSGVTCTLSIGVSERQFLAMDPQHLIDQADQALYVAKRTGRNRVSTWPETEKLLINGEPTKHNGAELDGSGQRQDQQAVVAALFTALHYRDRNTATHSARVASLVTAIGTHLLPQSSLETLQTAALLHDIGKIGIPDSILLRPDRLSEQEMAIMQKRGDIAISISQSGLVAADTGTILANYSKSYSGGESLAKLHAESPLLSISCNILHVCDAFDSMIHEQRYRNSKSVREAIQVLRESAPSEFCPEVIDTLERCLENSPECLQPLRVRGAILGSDVGNDTVGLLAAVKSGDITPIRMMMRRLKRESLSESEDIKVQVEQLEESLRRNDAELVRLFESTQEVLDLCRQNSGQSDSRSVIGWLLK
jgi:diguanylate cyclase (GGDEF)-like protein/PAS domain S-box-containing protein